MIDKKLAAEMRRQKGLFVLTILTALGSAAAILWQTWSVAVIVDGLFLQKASAEMLKPAFVTALVALGVRIGLDLLEEWSALRLATVIQGDLRSRLVAHVGRLSPVQLEGMEKGGLLHLLYDGIDTLESYFSGYLPQLYKAVFIPVLFLVVIFPRDALSAVIMLITIPLIPMFMVLIGKWTKRESVRQWIVLTKFSAFLQDVLEGLVTLKSLGRSKKQSEKIGEISEAYRRATFQVQKWAFISSLALELVATISIAMVAVGLGLRLCEGRLDFLIGFYILLLAPEYYQPMRTLGQFFHAGINAQEASKSLYAFLETPSWREVDGEFAASTVQSIRFDHVCYRYPGASEDAVKDVSLTLKAGQSLALIGESGSGKTTLMMLAMGFLSPTSGTVYVNDVPLDNWQLAAYHGRVNAVLQRPYIFQGTVLENIVFHTAPSPEEAARAQRIAETVGLTHLLRTLPTGLETRLGQGGQKLSGGQTALLMTARALYTDSDVLFLDEMTDNLDLESERALVDNLSQLMQDRMAWIIAHRLQTLRQVDHIYQMAEGRVVASGSYAELVGEGQQMKWKGGAIDA
ncbi:MAG: thiol reductant ABC exporter subunit CydD [Peptococcaceae bacterium]|nr:thiol reductant ABC exporter subunit CydD [Peptococcaceae bacterium]